MMNLDAYDRGARLAPAYLVFSSAVVFVVALSLGTSALWSKIGGILVACGAPLLAAQWGRSGGRRKQAALFASWGGSPTTALLRFRTGGSEEMVSHRHEIVARATGIELPDRRKEEADPAKADEVYDQAIAALRELTRDEKEFPLVLKENIAYGFRRNLWGRKGYGIAVSVVVLIASAAVLAAAALRYEVAKWEGAAFAAAFAVVGLAVWLTIITSAWVREAADAYATRLIESAVRVQRR
jgi:hypothetical protein